MTVLVMDRIARFLFAERPGRMWTWITGIALFFREVLLAVLCRPSSECGWSA
jgi:hypothetical protein